MSAGFKAEHFETLASLEKNNFWFKIRNRVIIWAIRKYSSNFTSFLEIGCGTGFVTHAIHHAFPHLKLTGSEYFDEGLVYARKRLPEVNFVQLDARNMEYESSFSLIGAFDVLEHIKEDELVLANIYKALTPGGELFLTVPQHKWLWSKTDVQACHERRYTATDLHNKLKNAGFEIKRSSSFVTSLLPAMLLSRLSENTSNKEYDPTQELRINPVLNKMMEYLMIFDLLLIKLGLNLPFGGSRLVVATKVNKIS